LGKPGNVADEEVQTAIDQVLSVAGQKGKPAGIFVASEDAARKEIARGFTFVAVGADVGRWTSWVQATVSAIRGSS
jgi:2-keto-3-deoxy-L-rhamnonate aldolase RhmA